MEDLPQLYYDVRIATMQLERLLEIARAALKPWPRRDSRGQVNTDSKQTANDVTQSQSLLLNNQDDERNVKLLDEILTKAQTVRDLSKGHRKVNTAKSLMPYMETSAVQRNVRKPAGKMGKAHLATRAVGGAQSLETQSEMSDQFTVERHGNKMSLPSKLSRGRAAIDKLADSKMELMSKMEGQHFVQLLRQQGGGDPYINKCLILRTVIEAVIDDVATIPTADWNVNSRNRWQALYRVQHHLDLIQQSMVVLRKGIDVSRTDLSLSDSIKYQSPHCMTYSSIKELLDYVESNTTLQLRSFQYRISELCQSHLVPAACEDATTTSDAVMSANIRNIHSLLGLQCLPVFVHMSSNK